jgi:hypothetical protein
LLLVPHAAATRANATTAAIIQSFLVIGSFLLAA